jgi:hypothetical protein
MWKLLLQLFAEDEHNPTEEVEASSVDATEEDVEFDDGEQTPQQTKQKNNEYAQRRIKAKKEAEQRLAEEKRQEFLRGVRSANEGRNRFTGREIVDEEDLQEFETMLEMEKKGLDPVEDYSEYVKERRREERKAEFQRNQQEEEANAKSREDIQEFLQKYDKETAEKLFQNKDFIAFSDGLLGVVPLTTVYEKFLGTQTNIEAKAEKLAMEKDARRLSSSGGLTEAPQPSRKKFSEMTSEEFKAFQERLL